MKTITNSGVAVEGWADSQRLDDGSECVRIVVKLTGIDDAARALILEEALSIARTILTESSGSPTSH